MYERKICGKHSNTKNFIASLIPPNMDSSSTLNSSLRSKQLDVCLNTLKSFERKKHLAHQIFHTFVALLFQIKYIRSFSMH